MVLVAYSVHDSVAQFFGSPFFCKTDGEARRLFADACKDSRSNLSEHPTDFSLYRLGQFDDNSGDLVPVAPVLIVRGVPAAAAAE